MFNLLFLTNNKILRSYLTNSFYINCVNKNNSIVSTINPDVSENPEITDESILRVNSQDPFPNVFLKTCLKSEFKEESIVESVSIEISQSNSLKYLIINNSDDKKITFIKYNNTEYYYPLISLIDAGINMKNHYIFWLKQDNLTPCNHIPLLIQNFKSYLMLIQNIINEKSSRKFLDYYIILKNSEKNLDVLKPFKLVHCLFKLHVCFLLKNFYFSRLKELSSKFYDSVRFNIQFNYKKNTNLFLADISLLDSYFKNEGIKEKYEFITKEFENFFNELVFIAKYSFYPCDFKKYGFKYYKDHEQIDLSFKSFYEDFIEKISGKTQSFFNFTINSGDQDQNDIPNNVIINIVSLKHEFYFINKILDFFMFCPDSCIQYIYDYRDIETIDN
ncbi:hypothetical protein HERIO_1859 [Hepatospora eriocheir]|uniref:Uncharacterized protein n=1 Tax=Hepatospora eriocheir TaxID=1081669 RepID=A0A1X0Q909_9MICR|nr:hypothetical protein HERIO_1859 [Hepatospora eriocheir]